MKESQIHGRIKYDLMGSINICIIFINYLKFTCSPKHNTKCFFKAFLRCNYKTHNSRIWNVHISDVKYVHRALQLSPLSEFGKLQSPMEAVSETTSSHFLFPCTLTSAGLPVLDSSFKLTHTTCDLLETLNVTNIILSKK